VSASIDRQGDTLLLTVDGRTTSFLHVHDGTVLWLGRDGSAWPLAEQERAGRREGAASHSGELRSPMPGTVLDVRVAEGETVVEGQALLLVEAMKMEHTIAAPYDGVVQELQVRAGQSVAVDQLLVSVAPAEQETA
jgi:acetyl-CoA/propionyl-CoA carboxylase biotin carboxyl carrier protein